VTVGIKFRTLSKEASERGISLWDSWIDYSACIGTDPAIFEAEGISQDAIDARKMARAICRTCPVVLKCREWGLATREEHGVLGGLSAGQRKKIHRKGGTLEERMARADLVANVDDSTKGYTSHKSEPAPKKEKETIPANTRNRMRGTGIAAERSALVTQAVELVKNGATVREASKETGISDGTIRNRIYRTASDVARTISRRYRKSTATHCPAGHEYTQNNTYIRPGSESRRCRICQREISLNTSRRARAYARLIQDGLWEPDQPAPTAAT
jgi:WhiB family redox-sensing transcriptional regulator